ncbi:Hsp70 family protein [Corynebacterium guangdongense]|uniref:Molecular chaperone DnaK (HSP70) n=1 Tax=Corynebacterium guangdongense TaxID=1783348 RepID=A0ABU1ZYQ0_9CORY|nr:Hsp70 family protein [Corynebacterium guangdongense]MDR7330051.1 molecular chaperone DnaK (HSP70) [Corynebacterium guangdongense]WJZ18609.1 Chaperone protein HscA [Corynebacterium guangdongense]
MRFGIDFGTTRTVIAAVDRGNYPVLGCEDAHGDYHDYIPSVVAIDEANGGKLVAGWEAAALEGADFARSFKRLLGAEDVTASTPVRIGLESRPLSEVLLAIAQEAARTIRQYQNDLGETGGIMAMLGVPANASSAQRLLTIDAFTRAGIGVLGLVNEPSAAAFEYTHRHGRTLNSRRQSILVYDLGGGTFDVSLVTIEAAEHRVTNSRGVSRLGGDDFDAVLLDLALEKIGSADVALGDRVQRRLLDEARSAKERLRPQTRRMILELGGQDAIVSTEEFYGRAEPLVEQTMEVLAEVIGHEESLTDTDIAGIYLVGGGSQLPLVPRVVRERYSRRVHRSPMPGASTAVGLAIAADPGTDMNLHDKRARGIGVFRERDSGNAVAFDPLVTVDSEPDDDGVIRIQRRYRAAHNVGIFRFVEFTAIDGEGHPGDVSLLSEIAVPFERGLPAGRDLSRVPVERRDHGPEVIEKIRVSSDGIASITIEVPEIGLTVAR